MVRVFDDPDDELRLIGEFEQRRQQFQTYKRQATPDQTASIVAMHQAYPYAKPGVKYALAAAGVPADSPEAEQLAAQSGQAALAQGAGVEYGGPVQANWFQRNVWGGLKTVIRSAATLGHGAWHELVARPVMAGVQSDPDFFGIPNPAYTGETLGEAYAAVGDSPLFRAADEILQPGQQVQFGGADNFLGQGFFPAGRIYDEHRAQLDKLKGLYGGDVSPGRAVAKAMHLDPGTKAFNVTSGLLDVAGAIYADPASKVLGGAAKISKARRTFGESADLFPRTREVLEKAQIVGPRKSVVGEDVLQYLERERGGRKLLDWVVESSDFDTIWRGMGRKVDVDTARRLAAASDEASAMEVLTDVLGHRIRQKPKINRLTTTRPMQNIRILGQMPGDHLDVDNLDQVLTTADDFLRNAKVPVEVRAKRINALAEITDDDPGKVSKIWDVASKMMGDVEDQLGIRGRHASKRLTKMVEDYAEDVRLYFIDEVGENVAFPGAKQRKLTMAGTTIALPSAHLMSEYANTVVPLPAARALRRELSAAPVRGVLNALDSVPLVNTDALDNFMQRYWKPFQLLRGAWVVRVIAEEQVRMGAQGLDSAFAHPISYIGWLVGQDTKLGKLLPNAGRGATDMTGDAIGNAKQFVDSMSNGAMGLLDDVGAGAIRTGDFVRAYKGSDNYMRGATTELGLLWNDEVARVVAGAPVGAGGTSMDLGAVKQWLYEGEGRPLLERLAASPGKEELLTNRAMADGYIDSVWKRIQIKTGGDSELIEAIATGELRGTKIRWEDVTASNDPASMKSYQAEVAGILGEKVDVLPDVYKAPREIQLRGRRGKRLERMDRDDKVLNTLFGTLMSKPTNYLSRSTTFRQAYWDEAARLMQYMDEATQQTLFVNAAKANLDDSTLMKMRRIVDDPKQVSDKITDIYAADDLAKAHALDFTKNLLYDLSQKSQFADVTRLIFPFAEAWREVLTRWTKLGAERPQNLRRVQQTWQSGFFQPDEYGEEKFNYGWLEPLVNWALPDTGQVGLQGRAEGLNMITSSFVPGLGPVIQFPAAMLLPDDQPWLQGLEDIVFPFGRPDFEGGLGDAVIAQITPAWSEKFISALTDDPNAPGMLGNLTAETVRLLRASGEYGDGIEENQRLLNDAIGKARGLMLLRGALQFFLPTGPELEFSTQTAAGPEFVAFSTLAKELDTMRKTTGSYEEAYRQFIDKHGVDVAQIVQGKAKFMKQRAMTVSGVEWERRNPDLAAKYDLVIGYFAPEDVDGKRDPDAWQRARRSGALVPLSPSQQVELANHRIASNIYDQAREMVGESVSAAERDWLREIAADLTREYPGYGGALGVPAGADTERRISELARAAEDPKLRDTDAGKGIRLYMEARTQAMAAFPAGFKSQAARPTAEWLRDIGETLAQEHPGFERVWTDVLSFELGDPVEEEVLVA